MANIYTTDWQRTLEQGSYGLRAAPVGMQAGTTQVGATVYELDPGKRNLPYHAHFGIEEVFLMLSSKTSADLIEYPDSGKISAQAGKWGTPDAVAYMLPMEPQLGYFEGEPE